MTALFYLYAIVYCIYKVYRLLNPPNEDIIEISPATAPAIFQQESHKPSMYFAILNFIWIVIGLFSTHPVLYGILFVLNVSVPLIRSQLTVSDSIALWRITTVVQIFIAAVISNIAIVGLFVGG